MSDSPARHLNLAGASNFRDLGGYRASDGRKGRWRQIFRSNHLGHIPEADIEILHGLGIRSPFDFRGTEERATALCGRDATASSDLPDEVRQVVGTVEASFLAAAYDAIRADYGDLEGYFGDGLGVGVRERTTLQARYLES